MPRSRRRKGVKPGKTRYQIYLAKYHQWKLEKAAAQIAKLRAKAEADRAHAQRLSDKYANYPGNKT